MITQLQQRFKEEHARYIVSYLFPEFSDIINEFYITLRKQYSWICIEAKRPAVYIGIDERTKKEKKTRSLPDPREKIEESYSIDLGINNHDNYSLWGSISKLRMQEALNTGEVGFRIWNFNYSYGAGKKVNELQTKHIVEYLKKASIKLPTVEEFYKYYYED